MTEIVLVVEESADGGFTAHSETAGIVTEADTVAELREMARDAVRCYFDDDDPDRPNRIRLRFVRDEVINVNDSRDAGSCLLLTR